jgi:hypothetical protein
LLLKHEGGPQVRGLDLSTSDGDGHAVVVLCEEPGMTGAAAALAAAAATVTGEFRDPSVPGVPVDLVLQAATQAMRPGLTDYPAPSTRPVQDDG